MCNGGRVQLSIIAVIPPYVTLVFIHISPLLPKPLANLFTASYRGNILKFWHVSVWKKDRLPFPHRCRWVLRVWVQIDPTCNCRIRKGAPVLLGYRDIRVLIDKNRHKFLILYVQYRYVGQDTDGFLNQSATSRKMLAGSRGLSVTGESARVRQNTMGYIRPNSCTHVHLWDVKYK